MTAPSTLAIAGFFVCIIACNVLTYRLKYELRKREYPVSYVFHFNDRRCLKDFLTKEQDSEDARRLRRLNRWRIGSFLAAIPFLLLTVLLSSASSAS